MKNRIILISTLLAMPAASCSDQDAIEPIADVVPATAEADNSSLMLLDQQGAVNTPVSDEFGRYRLVVNVPGEWHLHSNNDFVQVEQESGTGCDTITVCVGRNWSVLRDAKLALSSDAGTQQLTVQQKANSSLSSVANKINSSMGAGYSYCPAERFTMGTGIQIFNMNQFADLQSTYGTDLMCDDYCTSLQTYICKSDTLASLQDQLKISVTADVKLMVFTMNFKGEYTNSNVSKGNHSYAAQRLNSSMFTREVNYMNAIALANQKDSLRNRIFAPGFLLLHDDLVNRLKSASESERQRLCTSFIKSVGPCFISKSVLGCSMDYWISVNKTSLSQTMDIEALLKFKLISSITLDVDAKGCYTDDQKKLRDETQSHLNCRGGNPQLVSIFNAGDSLPYKELQQWMLDVEPDNAVLVNMNLQPIYLLFTDSLTRMSLRDCINNMTE